MSLADDARRRGMSDPPAAPQRPKVKIGDDGQGVAELVAPEGEHDFDALLHAMLPEVPVDVLEVLEVRAWGNPEAPYKYVKCRVRRRLDGGKTGRELLEAIPRRRARKAVGSATDSRTLVVSVSDWQIGKATEVGGGTEDTIRRVRSVIEQIPDRLRDLRRMKRPVDRIVVANLGDMTESTCGYYPGMPFRVDLNESDQVAVAMDLLDDLVDVCAGLVSSLLVAVVNSNHDQPRANGKPITDETDSRAFTIHRALARAYRKAGDRYRHVEWHIPSDPLVATLDLHGVGHAMIHGHQATRGATPPQKLWAWWQGQAAGKLPAGDCDVLWSGHYHTHWLWEQQGRVSIGSPTLDGGSGWLTQQTGQWSPPGMVTGVADADGVDDVKVLRP